MGCFNVACSISNLSIGHGTKVAFFPLLPTNFSHNVLYSEKKAHEIHPRNSLNYNNCYFNPFSLPIFGEYNDYGSLEEIMEDENTAAVENFFGISIQEFVDIISMDRDVTDHMGQLFESYGIHQELFKYGVPFDETFITSFGFEPFKKDDETLYRFKDFPVFVRLIEKGFVLLDEKKNPIGTKSDYNAREEFILRFEKKTGYILNVSEEEQTKVKYLRELSGMFVHEDIYKALVSFDLEDKRLANQYMSQSILRKMGFREKGEDIFEKEGLQHKVLRSSLPATILNGKGKAVSEEYYKVEKFLENWNALSGDTIDTAYYTKTSKYELFYDGFKDWINGVNDEKDFEISFLLKQIQKAKNEEEKQHFEESMTRVRSNRLNRHKLDDHEFGRYFKDWHFFGVLYGESIKEGKLKEKLVEQLAFQSSMTSCNRFYFPALNGEQHGNLEASKMLLDASNAILQKEIEERDM